MGPRGDFMAIWVFEDGRDVSNQDVLGQRFDARGRPLTEELQINTYTPGIQGFSSVAMATNGSFAVVWDSLDQDGDDGGVFGQRYDASGQRSGREFQVNTRTEGRQSGATVTMDATGGFVVAWTSGQESADESVLLQRFERDGRRVGREVEVNSGVEPIGSLSAALAHNGVLVVAWESGEDYRAFDVRARRFQIVEAGVDDLDADGVPSLLDNCPTIANPDQADAQGDGFGDACVSPDVFIPANTQLGANPVVGRGTTILPGVTIGDDAVIGEYVRLQRQITASDRLRADDFVTIGRFSTLGSDVSLGFATRLEGNVTVGDGTTIADQVIARRGVVIGEGVRVDALVVLFAGARVGSGATIEMGAQIGRGAVVQPGAVVPTGTTVPAGTTFP